MCLCYYYILVIFFKIVVRLNCRRKDGWRHYNIHSRTLYIAKDVLFDVLLVVNALIGWDITSRFSADCPILVLLQRSDLRGFLPDVHPD